MLEGSVVTDVVAATAADGTDPEGGSMVMLLGVCYGPVTSLGSLILPSILFFTVFLFLFGVWLRG